MVEAILEVMTAEHQTERSDQARRERHDMAEQLDRMQRQLEELHALLSRRA